MIHIGEWTLHVWHKPTGPVIFATRAPACITLAGYDLMLTGSVFDIEDLRPILERHSITTDYRKWTDADITLIRLALD